MTWNRRVCPLGWALSLILASVTAAPAQESYEEPGFEPIQFGDPVQQAYDVEFFPGARHAPNIPTPDQLLGRTLGTFPAHHDQILACFERWSQASNRLSYGRYGQTHEGRTLIYAVVSAPANLARLEDVQRDLARLADPRGLSAEDGAALLQRVLTVAWMGYSIHGDELSGCDASLSLAHHLVASQDPAVIEMLEQMVVVIDPCLNPDGRERAIGQIEQGFGRTSNLDHSTMQRGRWPAGRTNHYLFDLNRDWMAGIQPETRGRWKAALSFHPHLFVDSHEMGSLDTFLFYPQARPFNPYLHASLRRWQQRFGDDQAHAFDRFGWGYYTREWADSWAPFYSDSWGSLNGAVGMLYEQARTAGFALKRRSGQVLTYREAVHHQVVSSMANLRTLHTHRTEILRDYLAQRRHNAAPDAPGNDRMLVVLPGRNRDREEMLVQILRGHGLEIVRTDDHVLVSNARNTLGEELETLDIPSGALCVSTRQPQSPLLKSYFDFDIRLDREALLEEREELERKNSTKMYDATSWSLAHALDVDAWWCDHVAVSGQPVLSVPVRRGRVVPPRATDLEVFAWVVDGADDASVHFAARALEAGLVVHLADRDFRSAGRVFPRGSLLVRRHENGAEVAAVLARVAGETRVEVIATTTGRAAEDGPDLGGGHFLELDRPRVALLANSPVATDTLGHLWHHLDTRVGVPISQLDAQSFGSYDLRRYNVLILPAARDLSGFLSQHQETLQTWVQSGGTLIACGSSAAAVTKESLKLCSTKLRRNALEELEAFAFAAQRELGSRQIAVDEAAVWDHVAPPEEESSAGETEKSEEHRSDQDPDAERQDRWMRRFSPSGVFLRAHVDDEHWITVGGGDPLPAYCSGANVFLSRSPVQTPVRLAAAEDLRLSGLLWPEARERLANSAYLTVESRGRGQVILFATHPAYRGHVQSTARLLANAVVYGPGAGASAPVIR